MSARSSPSSRPTIVEFVAAVLGRERTDDQLLLAAADKRAAEFTLGLVLDDPRSNVLTTIEQLTQDAYAWWAASREALRSAGIVPVTIETVTQQEHVIDIADQLLGVQSRTAFLFGLSLGWRLAQRFGGAR